MKPRHYLVWIGLFICIGLFFQNCSKGSYELTEGGIVGASLDPLSESKPVCLFNGNKLSENQSVTAYLNSSPEFTNGCISETRSCKDGVLSGSFAFASCQTGPKACLFNGRTLLSGQSATAYAQAATSNCATETRTCTDGRLSGSYQYASCSANICLFNGQTLNAGQAFTYYTKSSVAFGSTCQPSSGKCQLGGALLDSSNRPLNINEIFGSCSVSAATCVFNNQTLNAGQTFTYYKGYTADYCPSYTGLCDSQGQLVDNHTRTALAGTTFTPSCNVIPPQPPNEPPPPPPPLVSPDACLISDAVNKGVLFRNRMFYGIVTFPQDKIMDVYNQGFPAVFTTCHASTCHFTGNYRIPETMTKLPVGTHIGGENIGLYDIWITTCTCAPYNWICEKIYNPSPGGA